MTTQRGTINKRAGSWGYRLSYTDDTGTRRHASRYRKTWTKVDAQRELGAQLSVLDRGHSLGTAATTVQDYLQAWFDRWSNLDNVKQWLWDFVKQKLNSGIIKSITNHQKLCEPFLAQFNV